MKNSGSSDNGHILAIRLTLIDHGPTMNMHTL